jgi:hypothetical protein
MKAFTLIALPFLLVNGLAGCADSPPAADAGAVASRGISREDAITTATGDATATYRMTDVSHVTAMRQGEFWVVDVRGADGPGVEYGIAAADGAIRERRTVR